jgi:hypothetical protein
MTGSCAVQLHPVHDGLAAAHPRRAGFRYPDARCRILPAPSASPSSARILARYDWARGPRRGLSFSRVNSRCRGAGTGEFVGGDAVDALVSVEGVAQHLHDHLMLLRVRRRELLQEIVSVRDEWMDTRRGQRRRRPLGRRCEALRGAVSAETGVRADRDVREKTPSLTP